MPRKRPGGTASKSQNSMLLLGIDTGGTFTDFVLLDTDQPGAQQLRVHKVLSTPHAPEAAILQGIAELGLSDSNDLVVVHGSTVATNAALEGKGVRTALITNHGLRDLLTIGRQARRELYNLNPAPIGPPVPRELCLETGGRLTADGSVLEDLTDNDLESLQAALEKLAPKAVAINLLFSWLDETFEKRIETMIKGLAKTTAAEEIFVSRSSAILPESREYERGITTWLNAAVGPLVQGYLQRLCNGIPKAKVAVMQSAGGTMEAAQAGEKAVHMLLSGPAGGVAGAQYVGKAAGCERLLSFDMGGTSTDVALLDGEPQLTTEGRIGPYPVGVPMVDMHTIGAGGGSIARVDAGGLLQVGPESAGADPGPACYGKGGTEPTVTDANLVLGRLRSDAFLGGKMSLDEAAARRTVGCVAGPLGLSVEAAAEGIVRVANEHMVRALRVMSVQRGIDPRELTLVSFGGAGGLHVCALAKALGMTRALTPVHAGVLSALGMLVAPRARYLSITVNSLLLDVDENELTKKFAALTKQGREALIKEGVDSKTLKNKPSVDLRYRGQSYAINLPWCGKEKTGKNFHARHESLYGHRLQQPVELVTLRAKIQSAAADIPLASMQGTARHTKPSQAAATTTSLDSAMPVFSRASLTVGETITGPALITELVSTTYIAPGWQCVRDNSECLVLSTAP